MTVSRNPERKFRFVTLTQFEFESMDENSEGLCINCDAVSCGVEPDARGYECEVCERKTVYGMQELLLRGRVEFEEEY